MVTEKTDTKYEYALLSLKEVPGVSISKAASFIDIQFQNVVFFVTGGHTLTPAGKATLDQVLVKLAALKGEFRLEIQGHADRAPVVPQKRRWWNSNMELSVLRALDVHGYISQNFLDKNKLVVSGHGSQGDDGSNVVDVDRRISLRLQFIE